MKLPIPLDALEQHVIALGKTGSGKSSKLRLIVEELLDRGKPVCIIDPKGDWWGLKSSADGKHAGFPVVIFGGEHADVPLNAHAGAHVAELIATGNRPCLLDLGGWMVGERTRFFVDFAATFFRATRGPRYLLLDEVHNFAPQGKIMDPDAGKMLHWANRLASEGRGKGITLIAASQRPQKVHKDFVTSCETLIAGRVIHKLDRDSIKDWIDGCADPAKGRQVLGELATMKREEAWVWSPEVEFGPERIRFPLFRTYDSFKPQAAHVERLAGWADVDLHDVTAKLQSVVAQAKANDPAELRHELARARARILDLEAHPPISDPVVDQTALEAARLEGYAEGSDAALGSGRHALSAITEALAAFTGAVERAAAAFHGGASTASNFLATRPSFTDVAAPPSSPPSAPPARSPEVVPEPVRRGPGPAPGRNGADRNLAKAERLILTALAQYPQGRTRIQVALLTGYAHSGGGFNNALSSLRSSGYLDGDAHRLQITSGGAKALGTYQPLPRGRALLQHWLSQLSKAERKALEELAAVYPRTLSKEQLASRAGYVAGAGGFNNALSRLRTLELVKGRGELKASEDLFG